MAPNAFWNKRFARHSRATSMLFLILVTGLSLAACASPQPRAVASATTTVSEAPRINTEVYFYPTQGQSPEQQERDRYECYLWAKQQTGFDPSQPNLAPHMRVRVEPARSGDAAVGAVTGAIIGSAIAPRKKESEGAVVGAIAGAMIGAAAEEERRKEARAIQQQLDAEEAQRIAQLEQQAERYRRAMTACLEGRGYTVR